MEFLWTLIYSAEESINQVIQAKFTDFSNEDADYPGMAGLAKKGSLPPPRPTKASQLLSSTRVAELNGDEVIFRSFQMLHSLFNSHYFTIQRFVLENYYVLFIQKKV